jgi:hypothetical protein
MLQEYHKQKQIANVECQQLGKAMDYIMSACRILVKQQYIQRQDRMCAQHFKLHKEMEVKLAMNTGMSMYQN